MPVDLSLRQQAALVAAGELTVTVLVEACLERIARRDGALNAVVHLSETALAEAERLDAMAPEVRPPLAGLVFGVKDIIDVAGQLTRCGSHAHDETPAEDAAVVAMLRGAGMIPIAKLATYEYALTGPAYDQPNPPARNPWNTDHITGGSSSGSAAAVAGGLMRAALGTDTGGSVRAPAAYCGVVGLKPTRGLVSDRGCFPLSRSLDVVGPIGASVDDVALIMEHLAQGFAPVEPGQGIAGLAIGYARSWFVDDPRTDPAVLSALDDTAARLSMLGARITLIDLPDYQRLEDAATVILQAEALAVHKEGLARNYDAYGVDARRNLLTGAMLTDEHVAAARSVAGRFRLRVDEELQACAALLMPTTLGPAPAFADFRDGPVWTPMRTMPFNMSGHPAISLPCGLSDTGLPLGAQLVGGFGQERMLIRIAGALEQASLPLICPMPQKTDLSDRDQPEI
jgi:aspartyl-tRNA(Asn)/glutamyl-tRNA(Gln) amidotransferase subunit A